MPVSDYSQFTNKFTRKNLPKIAKTTHKMYKSLQDKVGSDLEFNETNQLSDSQNWQTVRSSAQQEFKKR